MRGSYQILLSFTVLVLFGFGTFGLLVINAPSPSTQSPDIWSPDPQPLINSNRPFDWNYKYVEFFFTPSDLISHKNSIFTLEILNRPETYSFKLPESSFNITFNLANITKTVTKTSNYIPLPIINIQPNDQIRLKIQTQNNTFFTNWITIKGVQNSDSFYSRTVFISTYSQNKNDIDLWTSW